MERKKKLIIIQLSLLIIGAIIILFTYSGLNKTGDVEIITKETQEKINQQLKKEETDGDIFFNIEYSGLDLAGNRYILKSKEAFNEKMNAEMVNMKSVEAIFYFKDGQYNKLTGETTYLKKEVPYVLKKMQSLHKATTQSPVYWLNIFFGVSLMFFVISSFWMFLPTTTVFKKGIIFSLAGVIMTIIILFI